MSGKGFALVMVLAILVLMLSVILAFFSKAQLNRMISDSSSSNQQVEILTDSAVDLVISDLIHEIKAGSEPDPQNVPVGGTHVYQPIQISSTIALLGSTNTISRAPSLVPQRVVSNSGTAPSTLVKQSLYNKAFFVTGTNVGIDNKDLPPIPNRAAAVSTADFARRGMRIKADRWNKPGLASSTQTIAPPDWIYLNRAGQTPTTFSGSASNRSAGNLEYIVGRFAYNLYDVGGLIDINIVGNNLPTVENARRGRLHQVSLAEAPGDLKIPDFTDFVAWRSSGTTGSNAGTTDPGALFDPTRTFLTAPSGAQAFVTRQDLLKYVNSGTGTLIPKEALPFLTTFSRELNAPSYAPEPTRPMMPAAVNPGDSTPQQLNPPLTKERFAATTTLTRGTDKDVTVPAGTPVLARRFPLNKLDLLANENADPADLKYYFGLERQSDGSFRYVAQSADGRIKRLDEIAKEGREPNFFEVLQATVITGSIGRNAGNSYSVDEPDAEKRNLHIMQIGANVIDQWDEDDFPTSVAYPSGDPGDPFMFYGIENLPYINSMEFVGIHPPWNKDRLQVWNLYSVWNPHQDASVAAKDIVEFRIKAQSGSLKVNYAYQMLTKDFEDFALGGYRSSEAQNIADLNNGRQLAFPNNGGYAEPTVIGGQEPATESATPGILINEITTNPSDTTAYKFLLPAVPPNKTDWDANLINGYVGGGQSVPGIPTLLESIGEDPDGDFAAKTFNYFRIIALSYKKEPLDRPVIHLQYRRAGTDEWHTYQAIDKLMTANDNAPYTGAGSGSQTVTHGRNSVAFSKDHPEEAKRVTVHYMPGWVGGDHSFFTWRSNGAGVKGVGRTYFSGQKYDPRTKRFGPSGSLQEVLGVPGQTMRARTIRMTIGLPLWSSEDPNWFITGPGYVAGSSPPTGTSFNPDPYPDFHWYEFEAGSRIPAGFIRNIPEGNLSRDANPSRYEDRDHITRPADGYLGALPTISPMPASGTGSKGDRPVLLNRRFRTVGEIGYAYRDLPWKTLDFFTRNSGDLGLLDAFTLNESEEELPLTAGKVNLNSASAEVLQALLQGAAKTSDGSVVVSQSDAQKIAAAIVAERKLNGPFRNAGDMVARVLSPTASNAFGVMNDVRKHEREAAIRVLAEIGSTRTWNLLLDLIVQAGRVAPNATSLSDFVVRSERRVWVHLALDRLSGEVVDRKWEVVHE